MLVMEGSVRRFLLQMLPRNFHNRDFCILNMKNILPGCLGHLNKQILTTVKFKCEIVLLISSRLHAPPPRSESDLPAACVPSAREWIWTASKRLWLHSNFNSSSSTGVFPFSLLI